MKVVFHVIFLLVSFSVWGEVYLPTSGGEIVKHRYYTFAYSELNEQAEWVYYKFNHDFVSGSAKRSDNFRVDPNVTTASATLDDYRGSGYDRGHLCPAADMKLNDIAMSETFFLSNMSPQVAGFNRGIWKQLEAIVRNWAMQDDIYVVTGPVFKNSIGEIGNHVTIPGYFYKVVFNENDHQMIALVIPNKVCNDELINYVVSVDSVEVLTGIDFFSDLDDTIEDELERHISVSGWDFKAPQTITRPNNNVVVPIKVQCRGIAKSTGSRCKIMTTNKHGFCRYHLDQRGN